MKKMLLSMCIGTAFTLVGSDGAKAQEMSLEWVYHISGSGGMIITTAAALDQSENVIAVGAFRDSIEVTTSNGPVKLVSEGLEDLFVAKIDPDGELIWIKQVGGKGLMGLNGGADLSRNDWFSVVTDTDDNVYIAGSYKDTADFDPGSGTAIRSTPSYQGGSFFPGVPGPTVFYLNGFILKLNSDGEFAWVRTLTGKDNSAAGIALDPEEGTIAVTGYFTDSVYFDEAQSTRLNATGPGHIFVAKYDTAGSLIWTKQMGTSKGKNHGMDIAIDAAGNILTTGLFTDTVDFDPGTGTANLVATAAPGPNVFVSKLNRDGEYVWARAMGSTGQGSYSSGFGIATDAAGNVFTTGVFQGVGAFNPNNPASIIYSISNQSYFLSKLDANGNYGWVKMFERINPTSVDNGMSVKTDKNGAVYTAGYFGGSSYFDDDVTQPSREAFTSGASSPNPFLIKTDADGNFVWGRQVESDDHSRGFNVLVGPNGNIYLSGFFSGNADFNPSGTPHDLTAVSQLDGFVMKLFCSDTTSSALSVEQCEAFELNGVVYDESGSFTQNFLNAVGCDSTITIDLTINTIIEPVINVNGFTLGTATTYSSYQWFLNGFIIPGADEQFYTVAQNGDYRVLVTNEKGCIDTSAVYTVENHSSIDDVTMLASQIRIYPNPTDDRLTIQSPVEVNATLSNITGHVIREVKNAEHLSLGDLAAGMYLLRLSDQNGTSIKVEKVIKSK